MDVARPDFARKRRRKRIIYSVTGLGALALITIGLARLKPAAPKVDGPVWSDTVKRGPMQVTVHGNGTLVPEDIRWIPTMNQGRVENILVLPGAAVKADTILLEMSNPDVEQAAFDAEWQLKASEAEQSNLKVQLESQRLTEKAAATMAQANYSNAKLDAEVNETLAKDGLVPAITLRQAQAKAEELRKISEVEDERYRIVEDATKAQLAVQQAKVEQLRAQLELKRRLVDALKVRAGIDGVLQRLGDTTTLQPGQQLMAGASVARVANPVRLKAEIKVPETQAKDVTFNQKAFVDTRNGVIPGHVVRIDPSAQNGTRTVDVTLDGPLPKGAVPDLSVDGTIEIERLDDVMFMGRPAQSQPDSTVQLFKLVDGGKGAVRIPVKLGATAVSTVVVLDGLQVGDQVILSDMSAYDAYERVRLN
ncbi:MAG TPA: HlyD family efflux transporter periplasmic adaptor subunit [Candidatus Nitrosotalea sp.]|nr:HlyD family efflux transporter periplasmic adaptor subunit [Candidatus Nitrosotalea sp.]